VEPFLKYAEQPQLIYGKTNSQLPICEELGQDDSDSGVIYLFWIFGVEFAVFVQMRLRSIWKSNEHFVHILEAMFPSHKGAAWGRDLGGSQCTPVSSFGAYLHFTKVTKSACPIVV